MTLKLNGTTSGSVSIDAPATGSNVSFTLPGSVGSSGQLLSTDGAGVLSFVNGGKILQVVRAADTTNRTTTSATLVDVTGMSVTITPQRSNSAILIIATFLQDTTGTGNDNRALFAITDSSNNIILGTASVGDYVTDAFIQSVQTLIGYATPATTSAVTYKLRFAQTSATSARVLNGDMTGQMFAIEVAA